LQAHLGFLLEQRRAENALERAHQPAGIMGEVAPHRLATIGDAVVLEAEEHRRRDRGPALLQAEHAGVAMRGDRRRRVRGAEVDPADVGRSSRGAAVRGGLRREAGMGVEFHRAGAIARKGDEVCGRCALPP
jgi:hypothetical protein